MFYNLFIPLVGGEGYKAIWLKKRYPQNYKQLVGAAFLDRLSGMLFLSILSLVFILLSSLALRFNPLLIFAAIPILLIAHFLFTKLFFKSFRGAWLNSSALSLIIQILQVVCSFFIIKSLGLETDLFDYLFIFLLSTFAFVLPMLGAREMAFVFGAEVLGLNLEISLAISLLFYLCTAFNSLLGGYFLLFPQQLETKAT